MGTRWFKALHSKKKSYEHICYRETLDLDWYNQWLAPIFICLLS